MTDLKTDATELNFASMPKLPVIYELFLISLIP